MKIACMLITILLMSVSAFALPMLDEGTREIQFNFRYRDGDWAVRTGYGVFVKDSLLIMAKGGYLRGEVVEDISRRTIRLVGLSAEYNRDTGGAWVPYIGAEVAYEHTSITGLDSDTLFLYGPAAGIKYFITEYLALDFRGEYLFSDKDRDESDFVFSGGIRAVF